MVIAVILVTYFIDHVLDKKYPWIWPSLLCASGFGICCSTYLFLDMPIIDTWIFLFPLFYSVFFFSNSLKAAIPWTRRRSAGATSAFSPPSPEGGTEYFIRKGIVPEAEREVYEYGFDITIYTITSTLELLLLGLLLGQFLQRGPDRPLLHLSVLRRGYHASTHLRCFLTMCAGFLAGLGFSLLPCPLLALAVLASRSPCTSTSCICWRTRRR